MSTGMGIGQGTGSLRPRSRRPEPPEEVQFPVTPMLDMAFQLLAFFVLTFQAPSAETHLDLVLPTTPIALPGASRGAAEPRPARKQDLDLENDLWVRVSSDDLGEIKTVRLGDAALPDLPTLGERLARYVEILGSRPLRVRIVADDHLRYEQAARVMAVCSAAGVATIRLSDPATAPEPAPARDLR
jgi:biopolymer transport protein ExbD